MAQRPHKREENTVLHGLCPWSVSNIPQLVFYGIEGDEKESQYSSTTAPMDYSEKRNSDGEVGIEVFSGV